MGNVLWTMFIGLIVVLWVGVFVIAACGFIHMFMLWGLLFPTVIALALAVLWLVGKAYQHIQRNF